MMKAMSSQMENTQIQKAKIEERLKERNATGVSGAGMVEITMNGMYEVQNVNIAPEIIKVENKAMIETLLVSAFGEVVKKIDAMRQEETKKGLDELLGGIKA